MQEPLIICLRHRLRTVGGRDISRVQALVRHFEGRYLSWPELKVILLCYLVAVHISTAVLVCAGR